MMFSPHIGWINLPHGVLPPTASLVTLATRFSFVSLWLLFVRIVAYARPASVTATHFQTTVWQQWYVVIIVAACVIQAVLIGWLLLSRAHGRSERETLLKNDAQLYDIIESAMDGIITINEEQRIVLFNSASEKMFECARAEAIGQPLDRFIPLRFRDVHREHVRKFGEKGITRQSMGLPGELYGLRESGEEFPIEASISQIAIGNEKLFTVILRDITERQRSVEALQNSKEHFAKAFRANPQPTSLITISGGVYFDVNDSFLSMSGYTRDEVVGHTIAELKTCGTDQAVDAFIGELKERGSIINRETRFRTRSGAFRILLSSADQVEIAGVNCMLLTSTDITELKESEASLKKALDELVQLRSQLEAENIYLQQELSSDHTFGELIGNSDAMNYVLAKIRQVAPTNSTVLINGETGTGKELVARAIHTASAQKDRPLIKVNCAALSANLIESELFGHERGAFTGAGARKLGRFELADGGTIFLDEIGELPLELQTKLLRVIQEGEFERLGGTKTIKVNVRVISATNKNLKLETEKGTFREDLWYRLNVFPITMPPLRQRKEDIPLLVQYFVSKSAKRFGRTITSIAPRTMQTLKAHSWPGNVRELANVIERATIHAQSPILHLVDTFERTEQPPSGTGKSLEELEREHIIRTLDDSGWRIEGPYGAAKILGLNPSTLRARLAKLGIQRPRATM
jgi:PAS domain S-box-containing protein